METTFFHYTILSIRPVGVTNRRILKQATSSSWQHRGSSGIRLDDITKGGKSAIVES
jgi:hypothetical protein